uniref:Lipocalin/cytosolic fatty-acid binding domain-containing protein n=1 Tax=Anguilla anguilla TaxID=7936 RepID=A0A0E9V437_ANGAN
MYLRIAAVLGLLSVSTAGPLPCEDVVRPLVLEDFSSILGKWIVIEATVDSQKYAALLKTVNSAWVEILPTYHNNTAIFNKANMINGVCSYSPTNISISDRRCPIHHGRKYDWQQHCYLPANLR